ncbi:SDR family NAD(P)-dependent oxidoreductase [Paraferrimonas sp. SM1919]|uniref:SDR family NAD(P)-dependent oxidoreductase n=1 Tax=Paraferrimonas sp. SM1919 TaxID=2662263 RepID=UPI0013D01FDE|nr:SDR family NAD(P)-dependent oxidoreductase [Paraferrimonas sp. SM1919]
MISALLDASVIYSFDKTGYLRHSKNYQQLDQQAFVGKKILVTGGSKGIGLALTKQLLAHGAEVYFTGRNAKFEGELGVMGHYLQFDLLDDDMSVFNGIAPLDALVCNAGAMPAQKILHPSDIESIFYTQVISHLKLFHCLHSQGKLKPNAHIHFNSSGGMYLKRLDLRDLGYHQRPYNKVDAYANAKRAQVTLLPLLAEAFSEYTFAASHPGWVDTEGVQDSIPGFAKLFEDRLRTPDQGADTMLWCLAQEQLPNAKFWFDRRQAKITPVPFTKSPPQHIDKLWQLVQKLSLC